MQHKTLPLPNEWQQNNGAQNAWRHSALCHRCPQNADGRAKLMKALVLRLRQGNIAYTLLWAA